MDEADSATKALGLDETPIGGPSVEGVGSDTESEAEVTTMAVMAAGKSSTGCTSTMLSPMRTNSMAFRISSMPTATPPRGVAAKE